jgi:hypothetical protein
MHVEQTPLLQVLQLSGQETHAELTRVSPPAHEVHSVILVILQLEQDEPQPLQPPLTATKPRVQMLQKVLLVQEMQFLGQALQLPLTKV